MTHRNIFHILLFGIIIALGSFLIFEIVRTTEISTTTSSKPLVSTETYAVPLTGTEPTLGNPGAPNMIILFGDLGSRDTQNVFIILTKFVTSHPETFKLIWKDAPQPTLFVKNSLQAHVGAYCANEQHKFWPFATEVFSSRSNLDDKNLQKVATDQSLNIPTWNTCFTATSTHDLIQTANEGYRSAGITEAPTLFIDGKRINLVKEIKLEDILNSLIQ